MLTRKAILTMTVAAGFAAAPVLAFGQATSGGSSTQPQATQTTPQQGQVSGTPAARSAANGQVPGGASGGAAPGHVTTSQSTPVPGPTTAQATTGNTSTPRDGTPGNPPSTATQRAADSVTGNRTPADGTPGNPPGTAVGRAIDRTLGTNTTGANPSAASNGTTTTTTTTVTTGSLAVNEARLHEGRRASKVIGSTVYGGDGNDSIGSVDDLIVPRDGGNPVAILSVGGFLGIGAKLVAVPYEQLQYNADRDRWMLPGATKEALTALPTFAYDTTRRETTTTGTSTERPARSGVTGGGSSTTTTTVPATPAAPASPAR